MVRAQDPRLAKCVMDGLSPGIPPMEEWANHFPPIQAHGRTTNHLFFVSVAGPCGGAKCHEKLSPMEIVFLMSLQALRHIQTLHTRLVKHRNRPPWGMVRPSRTISQHPERAPTTVDLPPQHGLSAGRGADASRDWRVGFRPIPNRTCARVPLWSTPDERDLCDRQRFGGKVRVAPIPPALLPQPVPLNEHYPECFFRCLQYPLDFSTGIVVIKSTSLKPLLLPHPKILSNRGSSRLCSRLF